MIYPQDAIKFASELKYMYDVMIDSHYINDRANAEACRLGSHAWQQVSIWAYNPLDAANEENFKKEIASVEEKWQKYCQTGIPVNEVAELTRLGQERMRQEFRIKFASAQFSPETTDQTKPVQPSQKKAKKSKEEEAPEQAEPVDNELRAAIDPNAIRPILQNLRRELLGEPDDFDLEIDKLKNIDPMIPNQVQ